MSFRGILMPTVLAGAMSLMAQANAADFSCNSLVPLGKTMVCSGFEPNWAVELICNGGTMSSNFVDAFSGSSIVTTPGSISISSEDPWTFSTSTGVSGSIAYTPAGCQDESDRTFDFTFTPTAAPGLNGPFFPFCCRIE
jgi:hypothetical protein